MLVDITNLAQEVMLSLIIGQIPIVQSSTITQQRVTLIPIQEKKAIKAHIVATAKLGY